MQIFVELSTDDLSDSRCLSIEKLIEIYPITSLQYAGFENKSFAAETYVVEWTSNDDLICRVRIPGVGKLMIDKRNEAERSAYFSDVSLQTRLHLLQRILTSLVRGEDRSTGSYVIADHYEMFRVAWRNSNLMFAESTMTDGCFLSMLDWHEYTFTEIVQLVSRLNSTLATLAR